MDEQLEWVLSMLPSAMPQVTAQINLKEKVLEYFDLSNSEPDKMICSTILNYHQKGLGLEKIKDTGLHTSLAFSFKAMLSLGIDLKKLGK